MGYPDDRPGFALLSIVPIEASGGWCQSEKRPLGKGVQAVSGGGSRGYRSCFTQRIGGLPQPVPDRCAGSWGALEEKRRVPRQEGRARAIGGDTVTKKRNDKPRDTLRLVQIAAAALLIL